MEGVYFYFKEGEPYLQQCCTFVIKTQAAGVDVECLFLTPWNYLKVMKEIQESAPPAPPGTVPYIKTIQGVPVEMAYTCHDGTEPEDEDERLV